MYPRERIILFQEQLLSAEDAFKTYVKKGSS